MLSREGRTLSVYKDEIQLAQAVSASMHKLDNVANQLGITVLEVGPGHAKLSLSVEENMLNGLGILHGGVTFSLADTAFAHACNSRNNKTVALSCNITYSSAAKEGDVLVAIAEEKSLKGRTGVYDVTVTNEEGVVVALFRGNSYRTSDSIL